MTILALAMGKRFHKSKKGWSKDEEGEESVL